MLFDSPAYFVFLLPVVLIYWRLNRGQQNVFLLLASYLFYGWWDWRFLALMIGSTTMDFLIAQKIAPTHSDVNRKKWLIFSLVLNFSILGTFKYFNFFADSFSAALNTLTLWMSIKGGSNPRSRLSSTVYSSACFHTWSLARFKDRVICFLRSRKIERSMRIGFSMV
jgi:D-alanyl-lipoteichoic acid acyltransferase DltB (MBOAT superfamily)